MKTLKSTLTLTLLIVLTNACINKDHFDFKNINDTSWNPKFAIPLLKANVGVYNLFGATDSNAVSFNGKDVSLIYQSKAVSLQMDDIINLQDISTPDVQVGYSTPNPIRIPLDSALNKIESIHLSTGKMTINTRIQGTADQLTFTFLDIKDDNNRELEIQITEGQSETASLLNHSIIPDNGSVRFSITSLSAGTCNAQISMTGLDFKSVTGDFNFGEIRLPKDSFELYLFQNIAAKGNISINNPILSIKAKNSIGIALEPLFDRVESRNPASDDVTPLIIKASSTINDIKAGTQTGNIVESEIRLDNSNSNLRDFVSLSPKFLTYELGFNIKNNSSKPSTIFKNSSCELEMDIELPLEGRVSAFEVLDTIDMQVTSDLTLIKEFLIKTYTNNGFPLDTKITILLMDENRQLMRKEDGSVMILLDKVFTAAAQVDGDGIVIQSTIVSSDNPLLDEEILASLPLAKYGQMRASMTTTNDGNDVVKIQSDYNLEVRVGVKVTGNINLTEKE